MNPRKLTLYEEILLLALDDDKKKKVHAAPIARVDDPILAECLDLVRAKDKPQAASSWVRKFAGLKNLKERAARQLVDRGVLAEEEGTVLKIFKRKLFPEREGGPERDLRQRLERAIFTCSGEIESRTVIIVALAKATGMLDKVFDKKRLKEQKQRLEDIMSGQIAGQATREAVEAVQAAIFVCTIVPVITTAAT